MEWYWIIGAVLVIVLCLDGGPFDCFILDILHGKRTMAKQIWHYEVRSRKDNTLHYALETEQVYPLRNVLAGIKITFGINEACYATRKEPVHISQTFIDQHVQEQRDKERANLLEH